MGGAWGRGYDFTTENSVEDSRIRAAEISLVGRGRFGHIVGAENIYCFFMQLSHLRKKWRGAWIY